MTHDFSHATADEYFNAQKQLSYVTGTQDQFNDKTPNHQQALHEGFSGRPLYDEDFPLVPLSLPDKQQLRQRIGHEGYSDKAIHFLRHWLDPRKPWLSPSFRTKRYYARKYADLFASFLNQADGLNCSSSITTCREDIQKCEMHMLRYSDKLK